MNSSITAAEVLAEGKIILVPVKVPMPSGRVVAMLATLTALSAVGVVLAYNAGKVDGEDDARMKLEKEFRERMKAVEEKADARVDEIRKGRGHHAHEART